MCYFFFSTGGDIFWGEFLETGMKTRDIIIARR